MTDGWEVMWLWYWANREMALELVFNPHLSVPRWRLLREGNGYALLTIHNKDTTVILWRQEYRFWTEILYSAHLLPHIFWHMIMNYCTPLSFPILYHALISTRTALTRPGHWFRRLVVRLMPARSEWSTQPLAVRVYLQVIYLFAAPDPVYTTLQAIHSFYQDLRSTSGTCHFLHHLHYARSK